MWINRKFINSILLEIDDRLKYSNSKHIYVGKCVKISSYFDDYGNYITKTYRSILKKDGEIGCIIFRHITMRNTIWGTFFLGMLKIMNLTIHC